MTTDVSKWLDDVQARVDAAPARPHDSCDECHYRPRGGHEFPCVECIEDHDHWMPADLPRLLAALRAVVEECKYAMSGRDAWSSCRGDGHTALGENVIDAIEREIGRGEKA